MGFMSHQSEFRRHLRLLLPAVLLVCLLFVCTGCKEEKPPEDKSFFVAKSAGGAEFRLGQNGEAVGRLELDMTEIDGEWKYTGEMRLYRGDEVWMRVWQETDQSLIKAYLQTPEGACALNSWPAEDGTQPHNTVEYDYLSEESADYNGVSVCIVSPLSENVVISVLVSVDPDGTIQLNSYIEQQGTDGVIARTTEKQVYRFLDNTWSRDDRVVSKSSRVAKSAQMDNPLYGTADLTIDICREGDVRQLLWNRVGSENEGTRYTLTCTQDGKQTLFLQTFEDTFGAVTTEAAEFPADMPFPGDENGQVSTVDGQNLAVGPIPDAYYRYDGTLDVFSYTKTLREGTVSGFSSTLLWTSELYEGDRAATTELTHPKYRKFAFYRVYDPLTELSADVPVMRGSWLPGNDYGDFHDGDALKVSLSPKDMDGWDIIGTAGYAYEEQSPKPVRLGEVVLGTVTDEAGNRTYSGDVRISAAGSEEFRMYRAYDGTICRVMAEFAGNRWEIATCDPVNGSAPLLTVSRYVEMEDYPTPAVLRKLFYSVSLPDGTPVAQFITTNDGRLQAQLYTAENTVLCEFRFRVDKVVDSTVVPNVAIAVTEAVGTKEEGTARMEGRYPTLDGTFFDAVVTKKREKNDQGQEGTRYTFIGTEGAVAEASISVFVADNQAVSIDEFRYHDCETGEETGTIQIKGGLLYIGDTCVDRYPAEKIDPAFATTLNGAYCPDATVRILDTNHLSMEVRLGYEYVPAEKTKDGTILKPAKARRLAWLEIHERSTFDSWCIPLGYGSWRTVAEP